jgi:hypothetical protein
MTIYPRLIAAAIERAEEVRLDPQADLLHDDCLDCAGTGQQLNHDFPGFLFTCAACHGTARLCERGE